MIACMARGMTPAEVWMGMSDEVDVCLPIYPVRDMLSMKREGASEEFCCDKRQKWRRLCAFSLLTGLFFYFLRADCETCLTSLTRCLAKAIKHKLETSTFLVPAGYFFQTP
jgi:hypothetical protein